MAFPLDRLASVAASILGPTIAADEVFIMEQGSFMPSFPYARPLRLKVMDRAKVMKHPLEDGSTITDHIVIDPVRIEIPMIFIRDYRDTHSQMRQAFQEGRLFTVQTKADTYESMVISDFPHEEDTDYWDVLVCNLRLSEARMITPEYGEMSQEKAANSSDASTQNRGAQQTTQTSSSDGAKASSTYSNSQQGSTLYRMTH